jgi:heme-degrading monooxygenase HmoA
MVIVLFEITMKEGMAADYLQKAAELKNELEKADGFLGAERFKSIANPNKLLSKSMWKDEESIKAWRNNMAHRMAQKHGRQNDFEAFTLTVVTPTRCYTMTDRDEAPADSNEFFK